MEHVHHEHQVAEEAAAVGRGGSEGVDREKARKTREKRREEGGRGGGVASAGHPAEQTTYEEEREAGHGKAPRAVVAGEVRHDVCSELGAVGGERACCLFVCFVLFCFLFCFVLFICLFCFVYLFVLFVCLCVCVCVCSCACVSVQ